MEIELAIFEDCLNLIENFVESKIPTFKSFCKEWIKAKFQHVYVVQTTVIEVIQTTKTILYLAKRIICAKDELGKLDNTQIVRRIGGIYLMYAVYFKQPAKQYAKILLSYKSWQDLLTFMETLPVNDMTDEVRFIFWQLYKADAFRFTALDYDDGLEKIVDYDRLYDIHKGNHSEEVIRVKLKQKLIAIAETERDLSKMVGLEMNYNKTKEFIGADKSAKLLPTTKIFQEIQDALKITHNILDDKDSQSIAPITNDSKRKELKRKAARGIRESTSINEEATVDYVQEASKKYMGKPTVRTVMSQELPEYINNDLQNSTEDEDDIETEESGEPFDTSILD